MPRDYGSTLYQVGAARGRVVGRGLLALGEGVSGALKERERKKEREEQKRLTKSIALMNIYTKMGDKIPLLPNQRKKAQAC